MSKNKIQAEDFSIAKENKKDVNKTEILRSNLTNQFTLGDIKSHQEELDRVEKELKSQISLSTAVVSNVERNHPFVAKMSMEQLSAAAYLFETKEILNKSEKKLKEVKATLKDYVAIEEIVYSKLGYVPVTDSKDETAS